MPRNKIKRYAETENFPNVIYVKTLDYCSNELKKVWDPSYFKKEQDITVEFGCGKGDYTINLAKKYPDRNFIGIDIKGDRIWYGATEALAEKLDNVIFIRMQIENLDKFFPEDSISEAWITFPDPHQRTLNGKRRLTSSRFLNMYRKILKKDSLIHLKTDNQILYDYTLESIQENSANLIECTDDLYTSTLKNEELRTIQTKYENKYLLKGLTIKYILFSLF